MGKRQKRQLGWATFTIIPTLLIITTLVPVYLSVTSTAEATNASDWAKVKGYIAGYITDQFDPGATIMGSTNPTVSNVYPTNGAILNNITSLTITADLADTGSGIDAAATMVHLDISNMLMDCPVMTTTRVECNATAVDLALGTHPLDVYAYDLAGNETINSTSFTVADTIAPSVIYTGPSGSINDNTPSVTGTYTDPAPSSSIASATLSLDGGGSFPYTCLAASGTVTCNVTPAIADGAGNALIRLTDGSGNSGTASGSFTLDTSLPGITSILPSGWITTTNPATVQAALSDTGTGINTAAGSIAVDGTPLGSCTVTATSIACDTSAANFAQGAHTILVTAHDLAGNTQTGGGSFNVDSAAPIVSNIQPGGAIGTSNATVTADYSDLTSGIDQATVAVTLDTVAMTGCTVGAGSVSCPATGLADGAHAIAVTVDDVTGNAGSGNGSFTVDTLAPSVTNLSPSGDITTSAPTITADFADTGGTGIDAATARVILDGSPVAGCSATTSGISCTAAVAGGAHNYTVSVDDMAGNTGSFSGSFTLTQLNYYFPWYDNDPGHGMGGDWVMISNLGGVAAEVKIYVGDISDAATPVAQYNVAGGNAIAPNSQVYWSSDTTLADGPVRVVSTNGQTLLVSQRVLYKDSFNELMAASDADIAETEFDFTWYDNDANHGMAGNWIMVGNVDTAAAATADVYIGGVAQTTLNIPAGAYRYWQAPTTMTDGPVQVMSQSGQKLIVSQRVIYRNSFTEVIGSGNSTLRDEGFFTWYDNDPAHGMNGNWVMASNMGGVPTDIQIYLSDVGSGAVSVADFPGVQPGEAIFWKSDSIVTDGPVRVRSTNAQPLMTSQRVLYKSSFEEVQGLTPAQIGTNADFNWYDWQSAGMNGDWILIGNQNAAGKNMGITIASTPMLNTGTGTATFPVSANATVTPSFTSLKNGPVRVTCSSCSGGDKLIISQRVIFKDSFNEVVGRPRS